MPELVDNSPVPGTTAPITTLKTAMTNLLPAVGETVEMKDPPTLGLRDPSGQFRVRIDTEIVIFQGAESNVWTVLERGAEGTKAAAHVVGAQVFHDETAGMIKQLVADAVQAERERAETASGDNAERLAALEQQLAGTLWEPLKLHVNAKPTVGFPIPEGRLE
jgi:hypothetical protein